MEASKGSEEVTKSRSRTETVSSSEISAIVEDGDNNIVPRWFPRCCGKPILHGKPEALGWMLGMSGQTMGIFGVGTFVVPALMYFAKLEAGCEVEIPEGETELPECNETVYGLKPSSMITTLASVLSICIAICTPFMGAIIDYTNYRLFVGRFCAFLYVCFIVPFIFLNETTWFPLTMCLLLLAMNGIALSLVLHAYLPELADTEDQLNDFTRAFVAVPGLNNIIFIVAVIATTVALDVSDDEGASARIASIFGAVVLGAYFLVTWGFLMKPRPALNTLEEGQWMLTQGFKQIYRTTTKLYRTNISLMWFYVAVSLGDVKPLTGIGLTFLSSQQQFDSFDVAIAALIMLFSVVPGAIFSSWVCRKVNPVRSSVLAVICMSVTTWAAAIFLTGPNQKLQTYAIVTCWGVVGGWKVTSTNMLVAAIVPEGQDAELMGFYLFADQSLSWLPPLVFTAINEAGLSERVGLASITVFFMLGLIAYWKMGSYDACVKTANRLVVPPSTALMAISEDDCEPNVPEKIVDDSPSDGQELDPVEVPSEQADP